MNKAHKLSISNGAKPNCRNWKSTKQSRKQVFVEEDECTRKVSDSSCPIRTKYVKTNIGDVMLLSNSPTENRGLRQFSRAGGFRYLWNDEMNSKVCKFVQFFLYNSKVCSFIFLPVIWHLLRRVVEVSRSFCYSRRDNLCMRTSKTGSPSEFKVTLKNNKSQSTWFCFSLPLIPRHSTKIHHARITTQSPLITFHHDLNCVTNPCQRKLQTWSVCLHWNTWKRGAATHDAL